MKTLLSIFLISVSLCCAPAMADIQSLEHVKIEIVRVLPTGTIMIEIRNTSKAPIRIWEDSNSWGAARWRVLRIRKGEIETFYENPNRLFTKNVPAFVEIAGESHAKKVLSINGGNWCGYGYCSRYNQVGLNGSSISFDAADVLIAVYDVPSTNESTKLDVWNGVAAGITTVQ